MTELKTVSQEEWNEAFGTEENYNPCKSIDYVNQPPHYEILPGVEVYDVRCGLMNKLPSNIPYEQISDWDRACEYLLRMWNKNGIEDAKKAKWYLIKLIEKLEKGD